MMHALTSKSFAFSVFGVLIIELLFLLFSMYNGLKIGEHETFWLKKVSNYKNLRYVMI